MAWACAIEALRGFRWREYAPFSWILGAQCLLLLLAVNLESSLAMATVGNLARMFGADSAIHYPEFFLFLPTLASYVEAFLYAVPGSALIPLALIRISGAIDPESSDGRSVASKIRKAFPPTLLAWTMQLGLLLLWQSIVAGRPASTILSALPGLQGRVALWGLSVLGAYVISALFIYVPMVALRPRRSFAGAIRGGLREGRILLLHTLFLIVLFSWPALPFLIFAQLIAASIVENLRPEFVAGILAIYAALVSVASYLIFAAAYRFHDAGRTYGS